MTQTFSPASAAAEPLPGRRSFLRWLTYMVGAVAAVVVGVPYIGYLFGTWRKEPPWVNLGPVSGFPLGETRLMTFDNPLHRAWAGLVAHIGLFVRKEAEGRFLILASNCAHLGCPVSWFPQSGLFMCPCHGGVYYTSGERASGPPPRGLYRCVRRVRDGRLDVRAPHYPTLRDSLT
jgi:Rieske Fe-S protein